MRTFLPTYFLNLLLVSIVAIAILHVFNYPMIGIDDANIFFVYAKNVAEGYGFVYNAGDERVEGFTSMFWVLVCSMVFKILPSPELMLMILNFAVTAFCITMGARYIHNHFGNTEATSATYFSWWGVSYIIILVLALPFITWSTITIMENAIWSSLLLGATLISISRFNNPSSFYIAFLPVCVLLLLTRPESLAWVLIFIGVVFLRHWSERGFQAAFKYILPALVTYIATSLLLLTFRLNYFGYPLPNTFYAKVDSSLLYNLIQGFKYLIKYLISDFVVFSAVLLSAISLIDTVIRLLKGDSSLEGISYLPFFTAAGLLLPVVTGGDHFGSFRFYQYTYPILILNMFYTLRFVLPNYVTIKPTQRFTQPAVLTLAAIALSTFLAARIGFLVKFEEYSEMGSEFGIAQGGRDIGQAVEKYFSSQEELPSLGVIAAGGIKYGFSGKVIDLMGLNNSKMAHNSGDRQGKKNHAAFDSSVFFELNPQIVIPRVMKPLEWSFSSAKLQTSFQNRVLKGLYDNAEFLSKYRYAKIEAPSLNMEKVLVGWFHEDFLFQLKDNRKYRITQYHYQSAI